MRDPNALKPEPTDEDYAKLRRECKEGVKFELESQEIDVDDAVMLVNASSLHMSSDFYVMGHSQVAVRVAQVARLLWFDTLTGETARTDGGDEVHVEGVGGVIVRTDSVVATNTQLRDVVLEMAPYFAQYYQVTTANDVQDRELAGQFVRFFTVFESHGAVWHNVSINMHDNVRGYELSAHAPPPTPPPTLPPSSYRAPTTKATKKPRKPKVHLPPGLVVVDGPRVDTPMTRSKVAPKATANNNAADDQGNAANNKADAARNTAAPANGGTGAQRETVASAAALQVPLWLAIAVCAAATLTAFWLARRQGQNKSAALED